MADKPFPPELARLLESGLGGSDEARQGLRLIRAFFQIGDPAIRQALIEFAERIAASTAAQRPANDGSA